MSQNNNGGGTYPGTNIPIENNRIGGNQGGGSGQNDPTLPGSGTYTPDYAALIQNDPTYAALSQFLAAQGTSEASARQAATEQALIQFGGVPDFANVGLGLSPEVLAMLQHDIDPITGQLAGANSRAGLSTEAQLQQQQQQAIMGLRNNLASRGALSSGDDAYRTNLQNQSYAQAQQSALNSLLSAINGYQSTYLNARAGDNQQLNAAMATAQQFEASLPQNQGFTLHYNAKKGIYTDGAGNVYKPTYNGNGTWTLTSSAGASYVMDSHGQLTNAPAPPPPPPQNGGGNNNNGGGTGGNPGGNPGGGQGSGQNGQGPPVIAPPTLPGPPLPPPGPPTLPPGSPPPGVHPPQPPPGGANSAIHSYLGGLVSNPIGVHPGGTLGGMSLPRPAPLPTPAI